MQSQNDWLDLTKDQNEKIYKKIIRPGEVIVDVTIKKTEEELRPRIGDCVKVKLIGKTENSNVFLDHSDKPIQFNLFTGENITGIDLVVSTMIKGELCEALISSKYANGDLFNEDKDKIPRNNRLNYTIELIDWENEYLSGKNDAGIIRNVLKKGTGYVTPTVNTMVTINLVGFYETKSADQSNIHKFDERSNLKFKLSEGCELGIIRGLEHAIYKMKINEKNRVYVQKKYAFIRDCRLENLEADLAKHELKSNLNKLPLKENYERLIYEVELISFEKKQQIWELSNYQRFELCEIEKKRGAEFFKQNKFYLSLKCYSEILKLIGPPNTLENLTERQIDTKNDLILNAYNNMTVCYLKLKMPKEALKYANWVLEIDSKNIKALYRKGLANYDRNDFIQSIELFNYVLKLDPKNKAARNQINLAQQQIKKYEKKEKQIFSNLFKV